MYRNTKQQAMTDCGAACLTTIAKTYGIKISLAKMREIAKTDRQGNNMYSLLQAAKALGFDVSAVKGDHAALLSEFPLPAIAHIRTEDDSNHYVVLHKITPHKVVIADPASRVRTLTMNEFLKKWSGALLLVKPGSEFKKERRSPSILQLFNSVIGKEKTFFGLIALLSLVATTIGIATSSIYSILIDSIIPNQEHNLLLPLCTAVLMLCIFQTLIAYLRGKLLIHTSQKIDESTVTSFVDHILHLPMSFFSNYRNGEIISRLSDAANIREALSSTVLTVLVDTIMAVFAGMIIFNISHELFLTSLIIALLYGLVIACFNRRIRTQHEECAQADSMHTAYTLEAINNAEIAKSYNAEGTVAGRSNDLFRRYLLSNKSLSNSGNLQELLTNIISNAGNILLLTIGAHMVLHNELTLGTFFQFTAMLAYFLDPIKNILGIQPAIQSAIVSAERINGILELSTEENNSDIAPHNFSGDIVVRDLKFRYGARETVLEDASITIKSGSKVAIVGESGSGKSTLSKLLMKFYDYESGSITIGGTELRDFGCHQIRDRIAYVSQDIELFTGSIRDNLKLAAPRATDEQLAEACRKSNILDLIQRLPGGFDFVLDESGTNLSVGERQRLALARAFLRSADILILDEATSNIDPISEAVIWETISSLENITVLYIAHRLSSVKHCDEIYVAQNKRFDEHGTHMELLNQDSEYRRLWKRQFSDTF